MGLHEVKISDWSNNIIAVDERGRVILVADIATLERILEALRALHSIESGPPGSAND